MPRVPTKGTGGYVAQLKFVLPAHVQALGVRWVFVVICVEINQSRVLASCSRGEF